MTPVFAIPGTRSSWAPLARHAQTPAPSSVIATPESPIRAIADSDSGSSGRSKEAAWKPYYDDGSCVIYHGDCREILPTLTADAVVSDPPYGVGFDYDQHDDSLEHWFTLMDAVIPLARDAAPFVVIQSCAINRMDWWYANHRPDWLIAWHKGSPGHVAKVGFNDWEPLLTWGRPHRPMHDHFKTRCGFTENVNGHPCPKPIEWATWLVDRAAPPEGTVIDPFLGSGTVARAAKDLGRKAIGIELSERYCEIAAQRLGQEVFDLGAAA